MMLIVDLSKLEDEEVKMLISNCEGVIELESQIMRVEVPYRHFLETWDIPFEEGF